MKRLALVAYRRRLGALAAAVAAADAEKEKEKKMDDRVFEMRIYHAAPGKMKALHARFRDHTCKLFKKHGMTLIGFWSPTDEKEAEKKMYYILAYPSKEAGRQELEGVPRRPRLDQGQGASRRRTASWWRRSSRSG